MDVDELDESPLAGRRSEHAGADAMNDDDGREEGGRGGGGGGDVSEDDEVPDWTAFAAFAR